MNSHEERGERATVARDERVVAQRLRGVLLPFPTPFSAAGDVDPGALRANVARWNETGIGGYIALGSTGERVHLDDAEARQVVEAARAAVPEELPLVVGVGQQSTRATIAEAQRAADLGADALLVITPNFYRAAMTQDALIEHYERVADASPAPVVIYSIPQNTGITLAPETAGRLSRHENIVGLKESSGDVVTFVEMLRAVGSENFSMMTGHASAFYAALASGARGAILAVACAVPRFAVALFQAYQSGEHERARAMQHKLIPLARAVTTRFGVGGLKYALELGGYEGGTVRAPLREPDDEARREIARLFAEFEEYESASGFSRGGLEEAAAANKGGAADVNSSGVAESSSVAGGATGRKGAAS